MTAPTANRWRLAYEATHVSPEKPDVGPAWALRPLAGDGWGNAVATNAAIDSEDHVGARFWAEGVTRGLGEEVPARRWERAASDLAPWRIYEGSAPSDTDQASAQLDVRLPVDVSAALTDLAAALGLTVEEIVVSYVVRGLHGARSRRKQFLDALQDHGRIKGWMPDGTPYLDHGPRGQ